MNVVETCGLTRRFGRTTAVDQVDLSLSAGTVNVLIGANGAGKTTLIKLLTHLIPPSSGSARIWGTPTRDLGPAQFRRIGYVSENLCQLEGLTVKRLMETWRPLYPTWDRALEAKLCRDFELPLDGKLSQLSRGMAMKAALASVLAHRPELLILDEPLSGLDLLTRDQVVKGVLDLVSEEGCTVLVSSHEINEVETLADRLLWLEHGRLQLAEDAESLRRRFRSVELLNDHDPVPDQAWQVQRDAGRICYIDPAFDAATTPANAIITPLPLRQIYVALLRGSKGAPNSTSSLVA